MIDPGEDDTPPTHLMTSCPTTPRLCGECFARMATIMESRPVHERKAWFVNVDGLGNTVICPNCADKYEKAGLVLACLMLGAMLAWFAYRYKHPDYCDKHPYNETCRAAYLADRRIMRAGFNLCWGLAMPRRNLPPLQADTAYLAADVERFGYSASTLLEGKAILRLHLKNRTIIDLPCPDTSLQHLLAILCKAFPETAASRVDARWNQ